MILPGPSSRLIPQLLVVAKLDVLKTRTTSDKHEATTGNT